MALNKNALIRYQTIDRCLQNRSRRWTLADLVEACTQALNEYEGKDSPVSTRTVQLDLQMMRSEKLGYEAPIVVYERKYYTYEDPDYSITKIPLSAVDMDVLAESVAMLKQFKDFSLFRDLNGVIQKLEDKVRGQEEDTPPIIHLDKNEHLKGLEHLDTLYQAILKQIVVDITYQSFRAKTANTFPFIGYILKEFNNRWFLVGKRYGKGQFMTLALDRMRDIQPNLALQYQREPFDPDTFYQHTYGVTVLPEAHVIDIELRVDAREVPYLLTKPLHHSQEVLEEYPNGSVRLRLRVHHNFEIERVLLSFADAVEVIAPESLRDRLRARLQYGLNKLL